MQEKLTKTKNTHRGTRGGKRKAMERAITSFCSECALGEGKKCWHLKCPLAPYSPTAETITRPSTGSGRPPLGHELEAEW